MQLPPDEAVVMVSSVAPIKAKKVRYYSDANFQRGACCRPVLIAGRYADVPSLRPDDWSGLTVPPVRWRLQPKPLKASPLPLTTVARVANPNSPKPSPTTPTWLCLSPTSGLLDDDDMPLPLPRQLDPTLQRTSRLASLDPDDGIEL